MKLYSELSNVFTLDFCDQLYVLDNKLDSLWNPEAQYRIHKGSPITPILNEIKSIPRIDTYFFNIHSNVVIPSAPRPS